MDAITPRIPRPIASTPAIDRIIGDLAASQHDLVARWQLRIRGISADAIDRRLRNGRLRRIRPGVYTLSRAPLTLRGRWMADVLACGEGALLTEASASMLWGLRSPSRRRTVVLTTKRGRRSPPGIDLRTTRSLSPDDVTTRDGIPVTSLARTLADCSRTFDDEQLEAALEHAVVENGLRLDSLAGAPARLRRLVDDFQLGQALTRSDLEDRFRRVLKDSGLAMPDANRAIWTGERHYYPDFL